MAEKDIEGDGIKWEEMEGGGSEHIKACFRENEREEEQASSFSIGLALLFTELNCVECVQTCGGENTWSNKTSGVLPLHLALKRSEAKLKQCAEIAAIARKRFERKLIRQWEQRRLALGGQGQVSSGRPAVFSHTSRHGVLTLADRQDHSPCRRAICGHQ